MTNIYRCYDDFYNVPGITMMTPDPYFTSFHSFHMEQREGIQDRKKHMIAMDFMDSWSINNILSDANAHYIHIQYTEL